MIDRRTLFGATAATTAFLSSLVKGRSAQAKTSTDGAFQDVEWRGTRGRLERLPELDLESSQDFLTGFRNFVNRDMRQAAQKRFAVLMEERGLTADDDLPMSEILEMVEDDHIIMGSVRGWVSNQQLTWKQVQDHFHANADLYLAEMESADNIGPGSLELNPDLDIPEYTKHEIHIQPGGYVGDPFAGYINYYGVNNFYGGSNYDDEVQAAIAERVQTPRDGKKVERILDLGCATGRLTFAMKDRFPEAEVWGLDVGGPMVRFAHTRGVDLGKDVHYVQRLAEDTKFPDNHFDLITAYIMFHEVTSEAQDKIIAEAKRILRPGGVFFPMDFQTGKQAPKSNVYRSFSIWQDHKFNGEPWRVEYASRDFGDVIRAHGFDVDESIRPARRGHGAIMATKPA
ncbi:MAG: class I SAM-dependent methyltransferase [Rhodospirillaceae bacterium]